MFAGEALLWGGEAGGKGDRQSRALREADPVEGGRSHARA